MLKVIGKIVITIIVVLGIIQACKSHDNTWTIEDGHFKTIYDDFDECFRDNLGTGTTDKCYDDNRILYRQ